MFHLARLLTAGACILLSLPSAHGAGVAGPLQRPALASSIAPRAVLLAVARAGERLVAVGERGIVLLSDDAAQTWRQARVPVSTTLTAVAFPTAKQGWAVGHYGVVLHSADGGETWERQLDGVAAASLVLRAAQAAAAASPGDAAAQRRLAEAQRLEKDGPDKPFFDLRFDTAGNGFVVGAYNLMFRTGDGGRTWQYWGDRLDNPKANHLYAIRSSGSDVYLAGEQGLILRSADGGKSFSRLEAPYKGSFFALALLPDGGIVVAGLRGNAYRSSDRGATWQKIEVPAPVSFSAATVAGDGTLLLANQAGQLALSRDGGRTLQPVPTPPLPPLNGIEILPGNLLVAVGMRGALTVPLAAGKEGGNP